MIVIKLENDDLNFLKDKFKYIYDKLFPYLDGANIELPDKATFEVIDSEFSDAVVGEYDDEKDYMSDDGLKLEEIWYDFLND